METILVPIQKQATANAIHHLSTVWLVLIALALAGCATTPPGKGTATCANKLVSGDIIGVKIAGVQDPPTFEGPIDENGEIQMLYLGRFKAVGFTDSELAERIKYMLIEKGIYPPSVLQNMIITVLVGTRYYYITGEGARGRYPLVGPTTVCRALLTTGGTGEFANMKKVIVRRGTQKIRVNCVRATSDPRYDIEICSGDIIEVPKKGILPFL